MTKYKDLSQEDKEIRDYYEMRWVRLVMFSMFLVMGVWMLISPEKPNHRSIEKASVHLFLELWGIPFGMILLTIWVIAVAYFGSGILKIKDYAWIRKTTGYYLYFKKRRVSGLASIYNGKDLVVFHPENKEVVRLDNYTGTQYEQFQKAKPTEEFNNDEIYWSADDKGFTLIYKGESITDTTSEYRGDDLYVKSAAKFVTLRFKDYRNLKDGKVRKADIV